MTISNSAPNPRADWYPDTRDPALLRYWDGRQWTTHTSARPAGWNGPQWSTYAQPPGGRRAPDRRPKRSGLPVWAVLAIVVFVGVATLAVIGSAMAPSEPEQSAGRNTDSSPTEPVPSSTSEEPATSAASPTPTETEPPRSVVPRLTGMTRDRATARLTTAGLAVSEVRQVFSPKAPGTVLRHSKKVGASVLAGTEVVLFVAEAYPQVPGVVGRLKSAAVERLQDAGFKVSVTTETRTSGKDGVVLRQTPAGAARARPGSSITIVISSVVRPVAPPPPPQENCTPGYDPCLTPASDYDCAGGSGDGPKYTGFVYVTGYDPYDLDADGDGTGCE